MAGDSVCGGEGGGKDEGFLETIKDTWTKSGGEESGEGSRDGWGGVERWGERQKTVLEQQENFENGKKL